MGTDGDCTQLTGRRHSHSRWRWHWLRLRLSEVKWLCLAIALWAPGCSDQAPPVVSHGPGSGVGTHGDGGAGGFGGIGGGGGAGGGGGLQGACANQSDLAAIDGAGNVRDIARSCGLFVFAGFDCGLFIGNPDTYESCVSACVESRVEDLSSGCASCYGAAERCSLSSNCRVRCQLNACLPNCLACVTTAGCIDDLEQCTGIPGDGCD